MEPKANIPVAQPLPFRFSLRALLVTVTLIGCWLGWNLNQVRQREAFIAAMPELSAREVYITPTPRKAAPFVLSLLGARPVEGIALDRTQSTELDRQRVQRLFPEARVFFPRPVPRSNKLPSLPQTGRPGSPEFVTKEMFD